MNLANVFVQIKHNGLKRVGSRIDRPILCPDVRREASSPPEMPLSAINPPSSRSQGVTEVRSQNLYGSEPSINHTFEGGNMRLIGVPPDILLRFGIKTCMVPNLVFDRLYDGGNPRSATTFQNRIIEVRDKTLYGSESNLNYDEGRVSEVSGMKRLNTNTRV